MSTGAGGETGPAAGASRWRAGGTRLTRVPGGGAAGALLLLLAVIFPLVVTNGTATQLGVDAMLFIAAAVAWNIFSGFTGYISLGHAVFFGTGAYTAAVAAQDWQITGGAEFALLIALRVRRHTFVVITIAVFFIFQLMASNFGFTGGSVGLQAPFLTWAPETFNFNFYYLALVLAVVAAVLAWLIRGSRFGLQLRAIKDDEDRARGLGVRTMRVKLTAFVISGVLTGLVGALWFFFIGQVIPQYGFDPLFDLSVALMAFFGGAGTLAGPILGALILEPGEQYLSLQVANPYASELIWGTLFLLVILFLSRGVIPVGGEMVTAWRARRERQGTGAPPPAVPAAAGADPPAPAGQPTTPSGRSAG
jgi:branched-chain amino acid transport system permease protein